MTNKIVTPENTKKIAEWMGRKADYVHDIITKEVAYIEINDEEKYNPMTNAEQSREIEKKLLDSCWRIEKFADSYQATSRETGNSLVAETLELVIYKAALWEAEK